MTLMQYPIRLATIDDVPAIHRIYQYYIERSTCTFQMEDETIEQRRGWFDDRSERHPVTVCTDHDHGVVGWASLSPWNRRCAYQTTAEVSVYLDHRWQGRGIGRSLSQDLIERARLLDYHVLIAGICTEQAASLKLHESLGYREVARFTEVGRKFDRWLDVAYLQLTLSDTVTPPAMPCG